MNPVVSIAAFFASLHENSIDMSQARPIIVYSVTGEQIPLFLANPPDGIQKG